MKFRIQLKDPDGFHDGFDDAATESLAAIDGLSDSEKEAVKDERQSLLQSFAEKWVEYGEYITIEFDTDAGTATVFPRR